MSVWTEWNWVRSDDKTDIVVFTIASANMIITVLGDLLISFFVRFSRKACVWHGDFICYE
jgi:hypothetical protein